MLAFALAKFVVIKMNSELLFSSMNWKCSVWRFYNRQQIWNYLFIVFSKKIKCRFSCSLICLCLDVILSDPLVFLDILGKGALWFLELENLWTVVCFRMIALLKRFRLHFSDVIVMTDSEKRPQAKKYVGKKLQLLPQGTPMWMCFSS